MRAICIDDETLILEMIVSLCREMPQLDEVKGFTSARDALSWLDENPVDIALLDIDMPEMTGIELSREISNKNPQTAIIFLTGYAKYAVEAFSVHASGYLLKPVSREKLSLELDHAIANLPKASSRHGHIVVQTFGNFEMLVDGKSVVFSRSKSRELLAFLVEKQGGSITRAEAFTALWEDGLYDRSKQKQLDVIIRSLRTTLQTYGVEDILELQSGNLRIWPGKLDCDLYRFLNGDPEVIKGYRGEYMSSYAWARQTEAYLLSLQQSKLFK